ncbi:hypothetical protein NLX86_18765 [Streptomyces sp. A3M-1-3]|uniref:hypothetical protein n=1 Tax=Streptomyces sp. A3M-1-3 TaxID=2962044 RepID=UPI0020B8A225|nr:hypothetical protein [Streptomyces sp. A3M-1-3]MCP3820060.1 hypothetical protein [Streptomyces sp. A3M-1-3]
MAERLTFVLDGRDDLSRVLGHAGDSAIRLRDTMTDAADGSNQALLTLTRDADGRLRDLRGQFVSTADAARLMGSQLTRTSAPIADWSSAADQGRKVGERLKAMLISLAPAALPVAAAMAPLVASTAAAGVAVGVYAAALGPQIAAMTEAAEAEKKYRDAVEKSGKTSKEAVAAQQEYVRAMEKLPPATRTAAAALSVLKDEYKDWSDSLAKDTMGPFTKGLAVVGGLLPKLTPLVRGTSVELDRMMTILAGGMESPGFDRTIERFTDFSTGVLQRMNDGIVSLTRNLDTGKVGGGISEFMDYARAQGPVVGDTLKNIGEALVNVLKAGGDVGVGMLQVVNVLSKLVAAVPAGALTTLFQLVIALKLTKLAAVGLGAARAAVAAFGVSLAAMQTAAAGATGRMAALTAAFGTLSRGARLAVAATGIGLLVIAISELMSIGQKAPADLDKMTSSIAQFARSGKVSGEAARVLGADLGELEKSLRTLARPSNSQGVQQWMTQLIGMDSTPVKEAKENLGAFDGALANLVKNGNPQLAEAAFRRAAAGMGELGKSELRGQLTQYREALADAKFEAQLAAEGMGLFGQQALAVSGKLAAQKASADGLRQSINALAQAQLIARGGIRGMEAAIDAADAAFKENGKTLDENTAKGRANNQALDDLAGATMRAAEGARENGASWETVNGIYDRGRGKLVSVARQMGLNEGQAKRLADQILKTPDKTARLKGNMEDLQRKLDNAKAQLKRVPDSRKAKVRATIADLEAKIRSARRQLDALDGKTAKTHIVTYFSSVGQPGSKVPVARRPDLASGGMVGFPGGGPVRGPGTGTSDSILANLSNGEFVIKAAAVNRYGVKVFDDLNAMRVQMATSTRATAIAAPVVSRRVPATQAADVGGFAAGAAMSEAQMVAMVRSVVAELTAAQAPCEVRVFVGDREITDIVRTEVDRSNGEIVTALYAGRRG